MRFKPPLSISIVGRRTDWRCVTVMLFMWFRIENGEKVATFTFPLRYNLYLLTPRFFLPSESFLPSLSLAPRNSLKAFGIIEDRPFLYQLNYRHTAMNTPPSVCHLPNCSELVNSSKPRKLSDRAYAFCVQHNTLEPGTEQDKFLCTRHYNKMYSEYAHRRCGYVGYHEVQRRFHTETAGYEFGSFSFRDKLPFFSRSLSQRSVEVSFVKATLTDLALA